MTGRVHTVGLVWDTVIFLILMSQKFCFKFWYQCPILRPIQFTRIFISLDYRLTPQGANQSNFTTIFYHIVQLSENDVNFFIFGPFEYSILSVWPRFFWPLSHLFWKFDIKCPKEFPEFWYRPIPAVAYHTLCVPRITWRWNWWRSCSYPRRWEPFWGQALCWYVCIHQDCLFWENLVSDDVRMDDEDETGRPYWPVEEVERPDKVLQVAGQQEHRRILRHLLYRLLRCLLCFWHLIYYCMLNPPMHPRPLNTPISLCQNCRRIRRAAVYIFREQILLSVCKGDFHPIS